MQRVLSLVLHDHHPTGTPEHVVAAEVAAWTRPLVELLDRHPALRASLRLSGGRFEWLDARQPELVDRIAALVARGQVEVLGGGFHAPALTVLPRADALGQLAMMAGYLERRFGERPAGGWLSAGAWEPSLAQLLADAGLQWTLFDAGLVDAAAEERAGPGAGLTGYAVTAHAGRALGIVPCVSAEDWPSEDVAALRARLDDPASFPPGSHRVWITAAPALFGCPGWRRRRAHPPSPPGTDRLALLDALVAALLDTPDLALRTVGDEVARRPPAGRVYLPSALVAVDGGVHSGRTWAQTLARHPEADAMHQRVMEASRRVAATERVLRNRGWQVIKQLHRRKRTLYEAQCHDALVAGGRSGGLLRPELRAAILRRAIQAERDAEAMVGARPAFVDLSLRDVYADQRTAVSIRNPRLHVVLRPAEGGLISRLEHLPSATSWLHLVGAALGEERRAWLAGHDHLVPTDATDEQALFGLGDLCDLARVDHRLRGIDSRGRGEDAIGEAALGAEATFTWPGETPIEVELVKRVRVASRLPELRVAMRLRWARPLPRAVDLVVASHVAVVQRDDAPVRVALDGKAQPLDAAAVGGAQRASRLTVRDAAQGGSWSLVVDEPTRLCWRPRWGRADDVAAAGLQGLSVGLRRRVPAGSEALELAYRIALDGDELPPSVAPADSDAAGS